MNIFKRIFRLFWAEANSAVDKLEKPIKMTEQGIRDLKKDLNKSVEALANVKALAIRTGREKDQYEMKAKEYEKKATLLLQKAQRGEMESSEAERLAREALSRKSENMQNATRTAAEYKRLSTNVDTMQAKVQNLKSNIGTWENEVKTLKSRVKVSEATERLNKQLSDVDSSSTVAMLERMRDKVEQKEALAESYEQLAQSNSTIDDDIDSALDMNQLSVDDDLASLKNQLGMGSRGEETTDAADEE